MLHLFYMHFTFIISVFILSICDTEINKSINHSSQRVFGIPWDTFGSTGLPTLDDCWEFGS